MAGVAARQPLFFISIPPLLGLRRPELGRISVPAPSPLATGNSYVLREIMSIDDLHVQHTGVAQEQLRTLRAWGHSNGWLVPVGKDRFLFCSPSDPRKGEEEHLFNPPPPTIGDRE
jgi:hypothetical protein